jgi:type I restriction enzyme M protein
LAIKKSELYRSLWESCDELRGGMDASQYKDYVLVLLFIKYISDKYAGTSYADITIPPGATFKDMVALKGKPTIGDDINKKIIGKIAEANNLVGIIDLADFDSADKLGSGQEKVERLTNLIAIFENPALDFSKNRADNDDILGDAYEYLMRNFAIQSGKSKGSFLTPAEVSRVIAKIIGVDPKASAETSAYDPTCGSGSLLLRVSSEAEMGLSIFGQDKDVATAGLAKMNTVLHKSPSAEIAKGQSTLSNPLFLDEQGRLKTFDFVVANPPFSYKSWSNGVDTVNDPYGRFYLGVPPRKNGDYAFLLHIIRSMKSTGKGAVILPHGVLFRGNSEGEIRKNIIRRGYIKGIIGLPANLFYGTGIPACIIVLDKDNADNRKGVFIIDASKGFIKDGNKNRLREQDIRKIVDVFNGQIDVPKFSRMVPVSEIEGKEYNLNIPRYIDSQEPEDIQDIEAHLKGGIPDADINALQAYWTICPSLKQALFTTSRDGYSRLNIAPDEIKPAILSHPEFLAYSRKVLDVFKKWKRKTTPRLLAISIDDKPKRLIQVISDDLLQGFTDLSLIDPYDIYQLLLTYWNEIMQDDVYILVDDGWTAGNEIEEDDKKKTWEGRLIPKILVINHYFAPEQKAIEKLEADRDDITQQIEEMAEENSGEDGLLEDAKNEKGKLTRATVQARIKEISDDEDYADEFDVLKQYMKLLEKEAEANKKVREAQYQLETKVLAKYKIITLDEIKTLVIDDKWMARLEQDVNAEMQRVSQRLTGRVKELAERYKMPLPALTTDIADLEKKITAHLKKMGFKWT